MAQSVISTSASFFWPALSCCLAVLVLLGGISPLPYAILLPLCGVVFLIGARLHSGVWPKADWPLYAWALAFGALGAASWLWSVSPDATLERTLKVSAIVLLSLPLLDAVRTCPPDTIRRWSVLLPGTLAIAGMIPLAAVTLDLPLTRLLREPDQTAWEFFMNKNIAVYLMSLPPVLLICHRTARHSVSVLLLLIATLLVVFGHSQTTQLGFAVLLLSWFCAFIIPGAGIPSVFGAVAVGLLLMPWLSALAFDILADDLGTGPPASAQVSVGMRLENWDFIARKIMENPWLGFGMDTTRSIRDFHSEQLFLPSSAIMHPHNLALQLWIEFGLPGVVLTMGFFAFLLRRLLALPVGARRIPFTTFCIVMTFLATSWSIWASWLIGYLVFLTALTVLALRTSTAPATS